jgi:hypothetical protein
VYQWISAVVLCATSAFACAAPRQLDVLGLVPGVASEAEARAAGEEQRSDGLTLAIGGHKIPCSLKIEADRLAELICFMGKDYTPANNVEVHNELVRGFTKKFGKSTTNVSTPVSTRLGVTYTNNIVEWVDSKGNSLTLTRYLSNIDTGALLLRSAEQAAIAKAAREVADKQRRF